MKPSTLRAAGECLHGTHWQVPLARQLGINDRTVRGWVQDNPRSAIPDSIAGELVALLKQRRVDINAVLPQLAKKVKP